MALPAPVAALAHPAARAGWLVACLMLALLAGLLHGSAAPPLSQAHTHAAHASTMGAGTPWPAGPAAALQAVAPAEAEPIAPDTPQPDAHEHHPLSSKAAHISAAPTPDALHFRSQPLRLPPGHAPPLLQA